MNRRALIFGAVAASALPGIAPGDASGASNLKVIYVGGLDCPPCQRWKSASLEKWLASPEYRRVDWFEIEPARLREAYQERHWPAELKPVLDQLPRKTTTPRFLIVKDGAVVANLTGSSRWREIIADLKTLLGE